MIRQLRELSGHGLAQNVVSLSVVQFFRKALPLITIPFLTHELGPDGWGLVAIFQSLAACIGLLIEFAFDLSATRQVARCRHSREDVAGVVAGVLGAQAVLTVVAVAVVLAVRDWAPVLRDHPALLIFCLLLAITDGCNPFWYFVGMERMRVVAALEIGCKSSAALAMFALVRSPQDAWMVLALQALANLLSILVALGLIYRQVAFRMPSPRLVREALSRGWPMFLIRAAEGFYTLGNAFLLGLFAGPVLVGYFAASEKITRALAGLLNPIRQALYPRLSKLMHTAPAQAMRLARIGIGVTGLGGLAMGLVVFLFAPALIRIGFGAQFAPAVTVLRLLVVLPPLISLTQSVAVLWLFPSGRERVVTRTVIAAGALNLLLALLLVPRLAHLGMAWAVICSEAFVCVTITCAAMADPKHRLVWFRRPRAFSGAGAARQSESAVVPQMAGELKSAL
jgi:PST family polysaccharide transporter